MRMLAGHPCAVQLQAVYEDKTTYYLVRTGSLHRQHSQAACVDSAVRQLVWAARTVVSSMQGNYPAGQSARLCALSNCVSQMSALLGIDVISCCPAVLCCGLQVMELCKGGELFDQIVAYGQFSEEDAVGIMRSLLSFVDYAHSKHIVHR